MACAYNTDDVPGVQVTFPKPEQTQRGVVTFKQTVRVTGVGEIDEPYGVGSDEIGFASGGFKKPAPVIVGEDRTVGSDKCFQLTACGREEILLASGQGKQPGAD